MTDKDHWNRVYSSNACDKLGWYTTHLNTSLSWINAINLELHDALIDVGGGASTLVDDLLGKGHRNISLLDISSRVIQLTQQRLGDNSQLVSWLTGDITQLELPQNHYRLWHDRAVFHFLTDTTQQQKYKRALLSALQVDGFFIIGTFSPEAPAQCSGLAVERYTTETLSSQFGYEFELRQSQYEIHITPSGVEQAYVYCLFQRVG